MEIASIIITLLLFVLLILSIVRKYNIVVTLFVLTLVAYLAATLITGASVIAEGGSGNMWVDIFETFEDSWSSTLAETGFIILCVLGYAEYMTKIKAGDMFAGLLAVPIGKIKAKYVLVAICPFIGLIFQWIIPSGMSAFVMLLSTIYPLLLVAGVNPLTSALALLLGCNVFCGPANPFVLMCMTQMGLADTMGVADFFISYSMPVAVASSFIMGIVFSFWSRHLDKKFGHVEADRTLQLDVRELGVPKFYAIFPILPLVFIVIFSQFVVGSVVIGVVAAQILSLCIVMPIHILCTHKGERKNVFNGVSDFFNAMGKAFVSPVVIVAAATFFAAGITALGGMSAIINFLVSSLGLGFWPMLAVLLVLYFMMAALAGPAAAIPVIAPAMLSVATITGNVHLLAMSCLILTLGGGYGLLIKPFDPKLMMIADMYKTDVIRCINYTAVPVVAGVIFVFGASVLLFGGLF